MTAEPVDPLHDVELALLDAGVDPGILRRELAKVRHRWQGQVYIRSRDPALDAEIARRLQAGDHPQQIAKHVGVHRTTIVRRRSRWL